MQQNIGVVKVVAWVENILSHSHQVKRAERLDGFTERLDNSLDVGKPLEIAARKRMETLSSTRQGLGVKKSEGPGQTVHEFGVTQQTRPPQITQGQTVQRSDKTVWDKLPSSVSDTGTTLSASIQASLATDNREQREQQAEANEQVVQRAFSDSESRQQPQVNLHEVADRVYHLMQNDLILERERATGVGG